MTAAESSVVAVVASLANETGSVLVNATDTIPHASSARVSAGIRASVLRRPPDSRRTYAVAVGAVLLVVRGGRARCAPVL